ncbi:cobalamin biosynthesis protein [Mycolicibacterium wolinskyi]|uniref:Cobalamin biosynthesis protein n=1 Tax=Mycolicibacterium wolinskyi TaxID=59750 RepID=A0A132PK53_9MYCO|nr:cytosine permease [Mycolicibacterium wolinskyi]KWX22683.1 cobalamin biosynthesis protein [Mycolicibacterium wolinskyi]
MDTTAVETSAPPAGRHEPGLGEEYENEPVPPSARRSLFSVSAVWVGFPMIMTSAVFAGIVVYNLGFVTGMLAIIVGDLILMGYVGTLSYLAGRSGKNFALTAADTFGTKGFRVVSAFLSTLVIGWFAFQTGMVGTTLNLSMGWSAAWITLLAGVLFVALTFVGIRAISWIGVVASALFIPLGAVAVILAASASDGLGSAVSYGGGAGAAAFSFGVAVTMVFACFVDSGTMTADFTRWARNGKEGALAAFAAFPVAYFVAQLVGALIVALGAAAAPGTAGGDFLHVLVGGGGILVPLAIAFVFVNLGSVCAHCLYNGAVGFGNITGKTMRQLTIVLGIVGTIAAVAGIWSYFATWLNILGVLVPPIGIVLILDQLVFAHRRASTGGLHWKPFAAWAIGAAVALATHWYAPQLSDAVVAMVVGGLAFTALAYLPARTAQPALGGEPA